MGTGTPRTPTPAPADGPHLDPSPDHSRTSAQRPTDRTQQSPRAYVERRTAEGKSKKEIIRCLKRYVAREIYTILAAPNTQKDLPVTA